MKTAARDLSMLGLVVLVLLGGLVLRRDPLTAAGQTDVNTQLRDLLNPQRLLVTVDGATTFAVPSSRYLVLACTGAETINTITGGRVGLQLVIEHTDTECTLADDDDPTAANAIDLTGTATTDVGAVAKVIVLLYTGTAWLEGAESDN